jgi:epoxyqueuosine reductase
MAHWPAISGNAINGVGEALPRRPSPVYWHAPDATPHGPLQRWFYGRTADVGPALAEARMDRQRAIDDVFEGHEVPSQPWMIVIALAQDYDAMKDAPSARALVEVTRQYARGIRAAKAIANWLRGQGHPSVPYGGPMAGSFLLIPAAIEAGLGELGKHGSLIHRKLGSNFRLACVLTDAPLVADRRDDFGAGDFCARCRVCSDACPPDAIAPERQLVRGEVRWYVDFDKCLPYFNENLSCAICLAVCPFSRPGDGPRLVAKLGARRERKSSGG